MQTLPLVSVVTVTFNCAKSIQPTIESVASQTYPNIEHIIVDGESCDGTLAIIRKNEDKLARWVSEPDQGIYDAMNKGLGLASAHSSLITFLNAGDVFSDKRVVQDVVSCEAGTSSAIYGNVRKGKELLITPPNVNWNVLSTDMICHQAIFFVTEAHRKTVYDTHYELCADYKLLFEMTKAGNKFKKICRTVVDFDITGVSNTKRNVLHKEKEEIRSLYPMVRLYRLIKLLGKAVRAFFQKSAFHQL